MLKKIIKKSAAKLGLVVESMYNFLQAEKYKNLLEKLLVEPKTEYQKNKVSIIIFSKNRALQLAGLLASLDYFVSEKPQIFVLYTFDNQEFKKGYDKLIATQGSTQIVFKKEQDFKTDLLGVLKQLDTEKLLFLVDDIVFKNKVDLNEFAKLDSKIFVPSLRYGSHLSYAYTVKQLQKLPNFFRAEPNTAFYQWYYNQSTFDWAYPLSVDGHFFSTTEVKVLAENLDFKAPNSFEAALQIMNPLFGKRIGVCYQDSVILNNPCNKVQSENFNYHGKETAEYLNDKWLKGHELDFLAYQGIKNKSVHEELPINFIKKDE